MNKKSNKIEPQKRERNNQVSFRVGEAEKELIEKKFLLSNIKNRSVFYKKMILEGNIFHINLDEIKAHTAALGKIGTNINQLVAKANTTNNIYQKNIEDIRKLMDDIYKMENELLSIFLDIIR